MKKAFLALLTVFAVVLPVIPGVAETATNEGPRMAATDPLSTVAALADKARATLGDAVPLIAGLAGRAETGLEESVRFLVGKGWLTAAQTDGEHLARPLKRGMLARLVMKARGWGGGIMYSIFGCGRYSWRELVYRRVMPSGGSEFSPVSGGELLAVISRAAGEVDLKME